jgi:hypothetical protein
MKKTKGGVGRASLARLLMYKDRGCRELNLHPGFMVPIQCQWGSDHIRQVVCSVKNQSNGIVARLL